MDPFWLIGLGLLIVYYGNNILRRLPNSTPGTNLEFVSSDFMIAFEVDTLVEDDFQIEFVDGWQIGRTFSIFGNIVRNDEDQKSEKLKTPNRFSLKFYSIAGWFENSRIGRASLLQSGSWNANIGLPIDVCNALLAEIRNKKFQCFLVGLKRESEKSGKTFVGVYSFSMSESI